MIATISHHNSETLGKSTSGPGSQGATETRTASTPQQSIVPSSLAAFHIPETSFVLLLRLVRFAVLSQFSAADAQLESARNDLVRALEHCLQTERLSHDSQT
jgi:hypothetical protein